MESLKLYFEGADFVSDFFKNNVNHIETSKESCDYVVSSNFQSGIIDKNEIQQKLNKYKDYSKTVIVFLISDSCSFFDIPKNVLLFRTSIYKSIIQNNEIVLPYIWDNYNDAFVSLSKTSKPIVGFCGNVKNNIGFRQSSMKTLEKNPEIQTNFIGRQGFWGGKPNDINFSLDFKKSILESHFTLCNRGKGNFSIRFYQVLSLGRIPVLIDSDMVFPFEDKIKWDEIIIRAKTEKELVNKINLWWKTKDESELIQIQKKCKEVFDSYFTMEAFGDRLNDFLFNIKAKNYEFENTIKPTTSIKFLPELKYKINKRINLIKSKL